MAVVDDTRRSTAELAELAGITRCQAKNALAYLARKGRVVRIRGTWACSWVRSGTIQPAEAEPKDDWTPQPWIHPIRARALGLRVPSDRAVA